jgi:hypothetical protein
MTESTVREWLDILLVVPRVNCKRLKRIESLTDWFATFDVQVDKNPCDINETLGEESPIGFRIQLGRYLRFA